jgi:hypothetical protein
MPSVFEYGSKIVTTNVTITNGQSLSPAVDVGGTTLVAVQMPASWTTANLTLQASVDGTNFFNIFSSAGVEYTLTAAASTFIVLDPTDMAGVRYLKIRSGTSSTPVNQGADRVLTLVTRGL